jgi:hypothetical protein
MLNTITHIIGYITKRPQKAMEATKAREAMVIAAYQRRALEEELWQCEALYWETLRLERQQAIEIAEIERQRQATIARELVAKRRAWSARMHAAKAAKKAAKKAK